MVWGVLGADCVFLLGEFGSLFVFVGKFCDDFHTQKSVFSQKKCFVGDDETEQEQEQQKKKNKLLDK